jgi:hypothetical protein
LVVVLIASKSVSLFWAQNNPSQHFAVEQKRRLGAFFVFYRRLFYISRCSVSRYYNVVCERGLRLWGSI